MRGRPRKVVEPPTHIEKTVQQIIAEVLHAYCNMPGCMVKVHLFEASDIMDALKDGGFEIRKI
jgi:hypothetical protein